MSAKFLLDKSVLLFYIIILLCSDQRHCIICLYIGLWCRDKESYKQLLCKYDLVDVSSRSVIYGFVSRYFDGYCNVQQDDDI